MIILPPKTGKFSKFTGTLPELRTALMEAQYKANSLHKHTMTASEDAAYNKALQEVAYMREKLYSYEGLYGGVLGRCGEDVRIYSDSDTINFPDYDVYMAGNTGTLPLPEGITLREPKTNGELLYDPAFEALRIELGLPRTIEPKLNPNESNLDNGYFAPTTTKDTGYVVPESIVLDSEVATMGISKQTWIVFAVVGLSSLVFLPKILKKK